MTKLEESHSGLVRLTANEVGCKSSRGFESPLLRNGKIGQRLLSDFCYHGGRIREIRRAEKSVWETDFEPGSRMPDFFEYAKKSRQTVTESLRLRI